MQLVVYLDTLSNEDRAYYLENNVVFRTLRHPPIIDEYVGAYSAEVSEEFLLRSYETGFWKELPILPEETTRYVKKRWNATRE